jgi:hypothetical protein
MAQHTPGPWSDVGTYGATKFEVTGDGRKVAVIERIEDAHLIKAAPQMLDLLLEARTGAFDANPIAHANWLARVDKVTNRAIGDAP